MNDMWPSGDPYGKIIWRRVSEKNRYSIKERFKTLYRSFFPDFEKLDNIFLCRNDDTSL